MADDFWDKSADQLIGLSFIIGVLSSLVIIIWQSFNWLKSGNWPSLPLQAAFNYFEINTYSIYNPHNWHGLAKIGQWALDLPLSLCVPVFLISIALIWKSFISTGQ